MKKSFVLFAVLAFVGCGKEEAAPTPAAGASAKAASAPAGSTMPAAAAPTPAPKPAAAPAAQRGLASGQVIVGYLKDPKDEGQCAALVAPEAEKAEFDAAKIAELAKMMKSEVATTCPTEGVVGVCSAMGMLVNYTGPKYTKESAQADCTKTRGKWID